MSEKKIEKHVATIISHARNCKYVLCKYVLHVDKTNSQSIISKRPHIITNFCRKTFMAVFGDMEKSYRGAITYQKRSLCSLLRGEKNLFDIELYSPFQDPMNFFVVKDTFKTPITHLPVQSDFEQLFEVDLQGFSYLDKVLEELGYFSKPIVESNITIQSRKSKKKERC